MPIKFIFRHIYTRYLLLLLSQFFILSSCRNEKHSKNVDCEKLSRLAYTLYQTGDLEASRINYLSVKSLGCKNEDIYTALSDVYYKLDSLDAFYKVVWEGFSQYPNSKALSYNICIAYYNNNIYDSAIYYANNLEPSYDKFFILGKSSIFLDNYSDALKYFRNCEAFSKNCTINYNIAYSLLKLKNYDETIEYINNNLCDSFKNDLIYFRYCSKKKLGNISNNEEKVYLSKLGVFEELNKCNCEID